MRFSTKCRLVLCNIRPRAIAVIPLRIVSNRPTVAIEVIVFFQGGDIGADGDSGRSLADYIDLGERRKLSERGLGRSPSRN